MYYLQHDLSWSTCLKMPFALILFSSQREDELEEYYRNKYGQTSVAARFGEGEEMSDEITQQGLLPGVK